MPIESPEPARPSFAPPAEEVYRPISSLAVISLILGVISLLSFAVQYFLLFSVLALGLASWTLWKLSKMRSEYAGEMLAQIAVLLALISGLGSTTSFFTQQAIMSREAEALSDQFVDLALEGRVKEAFLYLLPPANRPQSGETDDVIMRYSVNYRQFLDRPFLRAIEGRGKDAQVTKFGDVAFATEVEGTSQVIVLYEIDLPERIVRLFLTLRGAVAPSGEWEGRQWYIHDAAVRYIEHAQAGKDSKSP